MHEQVSCLFADPLPLPLQGRTKAQRLQLTFGVNPCSIVFLSALLLLRPLPVSARRRNGLGNCVLSPFPRRERWWWWLIRLSSPLPRVCSKKKNKTTTHQTTLCETRLVCTASVV